MQMIVRVHNLQQQSWAEKVVLTPHKTVDGQKTPLFHVSEILKQTNKAVSKRQPYVSKRCPHIPMFLMRKSGIPVSESCLVDNLDGLYVVADVFPA
jgi:hypothetical protein